MHALADCEISMGGRVLCTNGEFVLDHETEAYLTQHMQEAEQVAASPDDGVTPKPHRRHTSTPTRLVALMFLHRPDQIGSRNRTRIFHFVVLNHYPVACLLRFRHISELSSTPTSRGD